MHHVASKWHYCNAIYALSWLSSHNRLSYFNCPASPCIWFVIDTPRFTTGSEFGTVHIGTPVSSDPSLLYHMSHVIYQLPPWCSWVTNSTPCLTAELRHFVKRRKCDRVKSTPNCGTNSDNDNPTNDVKGGDHHIYKPTVRTSSVY